MQLVAFTVLWRPHKRYLRSPWIRDFIVCLLHFYGITLLFALNDKEEFFLFSSGCALRNVSHENLSLFQPTRASQGSPLVPLTTSLILVGSITFKYRDHPATIINADKQWKRQRERERERGVIMQ